MIQQGITIIELILRYKVWGVSLALALLSFSIIWYLIRVLLDEDRSAAWRARFYKAIYKISRKSEAEKRYIENDISSRINLARRKMPFEKEYLPKAIKIEWFENGKERAVYIREDELVVRLDPAESQEKNIFLLTNALVKQTSLVGIRHLLNEHLEVSFDLNLVKNLLKEIGDRRILDWFFRNEYRPTIEKSEDIKEWNSKIIEIDERGLFTRLLLVELESYSKKIFGKSFSSRMFNEIVNLINFLFKISIKKVGQDVPLTLISPNIKIGVILVGETSKILFDGTEPYLKAFAYRVREQLTSIYIIQFDKELLGEKDTAAYEEFINLTQRLDQEIKEKFQIQKDFELNYKCTDSLDRIRKATISRYIPKYLS